MTLSFQTSHDIAATVRLAEQYGIRPSQLLEGTGVTASFIADPYTRVSAVQQRLLMLNLSRLLDTPDAGLTLGDKMGVQQLGPIGLAIQSCPSTRESAAIATKYKALLGWQHGFHHRFKQDSAIVTFSNREADPYLAQFLLERSFASIRRIGLDIRVVQTPPKLIRFQFDRPRQFNRYEQFFECPVEFGCNQSEMHYSAPPEGTPLRSPDRRVQRSLIRLLDELLLELKSHSDMAARVEFILLQANGEYPSLKQVAQQLGVSPRSLSRQLTSSGTGYREILDKVKKQLALDKLMNTKLTVYEIGTLCGFKDPASFVEAFKRWTCYPPSHFRAQVPANTDVS